MRERLEKALHSGEMELKERLFRLILIVGLIVSLVAIFAGFFLKDILNNTLPLCCIIVVIIAASAAAFNYHKTDFAAMLFAVFIICFIFPVIFFASGGIDGGASIWFVLGILYIFLMFEGKKLIFFLTLAVVADTVTYVTAYQNEGLICALGSKSEIYYDSLFSVLTVGISVGMIMRFQRKLYEKERDLTNRQKEEIQEISRSKEAFFTNISHEIRTPINTIMGLNEMILREDISDEVAQDAMNIKNASKLLLALVNDIIDFSQIESKQMAIVPVQYQTKNLIQDVVDLLQSRVLEKKLNFYLDIDSSLPRVLLGDEVRIKQILVNLLTNAVKYTPKGSVTFMVHGESAGEDTVCLTMAVSDTGMGIKKEELAYLYDSFKRADQKRNRKVEGNGLGLAITRQLVSLMGGKITVDSIYTKGSVFTVTLNQHIVDARPVGKMNYLERLHGTERSYYKQSFEASQARVLVVDDNEVNRMIAQKLLRATRMQIDTAKNGEECLEYTKKKIYHVILLDSMMPDMDGLTVLKEIHRQENGLCRQAPILAWTADISVQNQQRYLDAGFDGYLPKPAEGSQLEAEILKFLPEELIEYKMNAEERKDAVAAAQVVMRRKRKKIQIAADCICDLSKEYVKKFDLKIMYQYVETAQGCFQDTKEIDANNLNRLTDKGSVRAVSAPIAEYEAFYAQALTQAEELIFISMASNTGGSYAAAVEAAKGFDHVHVIDAGHISCGEGLVVLSAASMANEDNLPAEKICAELERMKKYVETSFLLPNIRYYHRSGFTKQAVATVFDLLGLHPLLQMRQSYLKLTGCYAGNLKMAKKRYIHKQLRNKKKIDARVVCITHAGCTLQQQNEFVDEVIRQIPFEKVIVQKVSVSCACNAGPGTMGLSYLKKQKGKQFDCRK